MKLPPARIALAATSVRNNVLKLTRKVVPPGAAVLEMVQGAWNAQALYAAAKLGISDVLADGPKSARDVAETIGADADGVARLMRHLTTMGFYKATRAGTFRLTPIGDVLRTGTPGSMRDMVLWVGDPAHRDDWDELPYSVMTGKTGVARLRGKGLFEYFEEDNPDLSETFNGAMTSVSSLVDDAVLAAYDFSGFRTIADVGGGHGSFLSDIVSRTPGTRGILFDLPSVVAGNVFAERGLIDRCEAVGGSFFESVPAGADCYVLRIVIHDWAEDECLTILGNVRQGINPGGRLLLVELVLPDDPSIPHPGTLTDLEMLVSVGGRERTRAGYAELLAKAGFAVTRVVPTAGPMSIVEAEPV
jgi:hypothetical protein